MTTRGEACHSSYVHILHNAYEQILSQRHVDPVHVQVSLTSYMPGIMSLNDNQGRDSQRWLSLQPSLA